MNKPGFVYGTFGNKQITTCNTARKNIKTGEVQFLLWKPGEEGHPNGYWHRVGMGWKETFIQDK